MNRSIDMPASLCADPLTLAAPAPAPSTASVQQPMGLEQFEDTFERAAVGIFRSTPEGRFLRVNPKLAALFGYTSEEMTALEDIGRGIYVDPRRRAEFTRIINHNGAVMNFESEVYRRNGQRMWISENAWAVRDAAEGVSYYEGFLEEIRPPRSRPTSDTSRHRAASMEEARTQLFQAIGDAGGTPVDGVLSLLELLADDHVAPQSNSMDTSQGPFDLSNLLKRCSGDGQFCAVILHKFAARGRDQVSALERAINGANAAELELQARTLVGLASNLAAEDLRRHSAELEQVAQSGDLTQAPELLEHVRQEVERCIAAVPQILQQLNPRQD